MTDQEPKPIFQEAKSVFQEAKSVFQEAKSVFQEAKSVFQEAKSVFQEAKSVFQEAKSVFQEDVYDILTKGLSGEKYRKQNTDEAIKRILLDKKFGTSLGYRQIILKVSPIMPNGIEEIINKSRKGDWENMGEILFRRNSLRFRLCTKLGYSYNDADPESSAYQPVYLNQFNYSIIAPITLFNDANYPVVNFMSPEFIPIIDNRYLNPGTDKGWIEVRKLYYQIKKEMDSLKGEKIRVSDLIKTTGSDILKELGEEIIKYVKEAEEKIGEVK